VSSVGGDSNLFVVEYFVGDILSIHN